MPEFRPDHLTVSHLCDRFGLGTSIGRLVTVARGAMGRIWRLDLSDGRRYAVKELFVDRVEPAAAREASFVELSGVRAPRYLRTTDGLLVYRLPSALGGVQVRLYSWVEGRTTRPGDPGRARWFGSTLGRLHALRPSADGLEPDPWYDHCTGPERWRELLARAGGAGLTEVTARLRDLLPALTEFSGLVTPGDRAEMVLCHRDLQPHNVLMDGAEGGYTLLDWENAGPAVPARELATGLCDWNVHDGQVDEAGVRETLRAYREFGGNAVLADLSDFGTHFAVYLNYLEVLLSQRLDAGPSGTTVLDAGLSRATVEHLDTELRAQLTDPPSTRIAERLLELGE